jgi:hypothetical protein
MHLLKYNNNNNNNSNNSNNKPRDRVDLSSKGPSPLDGGAVAFLNLPRPAEILSFYEAVRRATSIA